MRFTIASAILFFGSFSLYALATPILTAPSLAARGRAVVADPVPGYPFIPPVGESTGSTFAAGDTWAKFDHFFTTGPNASPERLVRATDFLDTKIAASSSAMWGDGTLTSDGASWLNEGLHLGMF